MGAWNMLQKYEEIFYRGLFGFGAGVLDTALNTRMASRGFRDEMAPRRPILFYLALFVVFALALGWLLFHRT